MFTELFKTTKERAEGGEDWRISRNPGFGTRNPDYAEIEFSYFLRKYFFAVKCKKTLAKTSAIQVKITLQVAFRFCFSVKSSSQTKTYQKGFIPSRVSQPNFYYKSQRYLPETNGY